MQVAQGMLSVVADVLTPSEEHFEWVLLCEQQQQVAGAGGGVEESRLLLVFDPHLRFT